MKKLYLNNIRKYVLLSEEYYQEILEVEAENRIKRSLEDIKSKKTTRGTAKNLIKELGLED